MINETYEWLCDHYALSLMQSQQEIEALSRDIQSCAGASDQVRLRDKIDRLCVVRGTDAFTVGLQLGLRLMAGQREGGLTLI